MFFTLSEMVLGYDTALAGENDNGNTPCGIAWVKS